MKCKICGNRIADDTSKCSVCGATVSGNSESGNKVENLNLKKIKCLNCGEMVIGEHRFCPKCSVEFTKNEKDVVSSFQKEKSDVFPLGNDIKDRESKKNNLKKGIDNSVVNDIPPSTVKKSKVGADAIVCLIAGIFYVISGMVLFGMLVSGGGFSVCDDVNGFFAVLSVFIASIVFFIAGVYSVLIFIDEKCKNK